MNYQASSGDREFLRAFEAGTTNPSAFDHAAHLRVAYSYLCEGSVDASARRMKQSLLAFLSHHGVGPGKYHETVTRAWIMAVAHFMAETLPCSSAADFISANTILLDRRIMLTHYSADMLFSPEARRTFVEPDIQPIPPR